MTDGRKSSSGVVSNGPSPAGEVDVGDGGLSREVIGDLSGRFFDAPDGHTVRLVGDLDGSAVYHRVGLTDAVNATLMSVPWEDFEEEFDLVGRTPPGWDE